MNNVVLPITIRVPNEIRLRKEVIKDMKNFNGGYLGKCISQSSCSRM